MLKLSIRWRAWVAAVLLLALPLQGLATASMRGCGPTGGWTGAAAPGYTAAPAGHEGHAAHARHDGHAQQGAHHGADTPADATSATAAAEADTGCSVCAACFVGAALPACEAVFGARTQPQTLTAGSTPGAPGTSPHGLERPPRSDRA